MTVNLNAVVRFQVSVAEAAVAVVGADVAHHVVDPEDLLGLDPLRATPLETALPVIAAPGALPGRAPWGAPPLEPARRVIAAQEPEMWVLPLPVPGSPGSLRGPAE